MTQRWRRLGVTSLICVLLVAVAALLLTASLGPNGRRMLSLPAGLDDWTTHNSISPPPGDWDNLLLYDSIGASAAVDRNGSIWYDYVGSEYSYRHEGDCAAGNCWAATQKHCTSPTTEGYVSVYVYVPTVPPKNEAGTNKYPLVALGDVTFSGEPPTMNMGVRILYWPELETLYVACDNCDPSWWWPIGQLMEAQWHHFEIEWDLSAGLTDTGVLRVWKDDILYLDFSNLATDAAPGYKNINDFVAGVVEWPTGLTAMVTYVDYATFYGCAPETFPTPTPAPTNACQTWGNSAVVNVAADCCGLIRFDGVGPLVPVTATLNYIGLRIYGVAVDEPGETITITPVGSSWGEQTADWCVRTWMDHWAEAGAEKVPDDRGATAAGSLVTKLGWQEVSLDPSVIGIGWLLNQPNPGIILHNDTMTGKFSIASSEWYDPLIDYGPQLIITYE